MSDYANAINANIEQPKGEQFVLFPGLLPDSNEDDGLAGQRLVEFSEFEGRRVRAVIEDPTGPKSNNVAAVFVFDDGAWATVYAEKDEPDEAPSVYLRTFSGTHRRGGCITDYAEGYELFGVGLITQGQYDELKKIESERRQAQAKKKVELLEASIARTKAEAGIE